MRQLMVSQNTGCVVSRSTQPGGLARPLTRTSKPMATRPFLSLTEAAEAAGCAQRQGVQFMFQLYSQGLGGILADDMVSAPCHAFAPELYGTGGARIRIRIGLRTLYFDRCQLMKIVRYQTKRPSSAGSTDEALAWCIGQ